MALVYDVWTDMDPDTLSAAALSIYERWVAFALGKAEIGGKSVMHPTGRMAAAIDVDQVSPTHIMIVADSPEAEILEEGHGEIDLKNSLTAGRAYPMHRGGPGSQALFPSILGGNVRAVAAQMRSAMFTGFARVPSQMTA